MVINDSNIKEIYALGKKYIYNKFKQIYHENDYNYIIGLAIVEMNKIEIVEPMIKPYFLRKVFFECVRIQKRLTHRKISINYDIVINTLTQIDNASPLYLLFDSSVISDKERELIDLYLHFQTVAKIAEYKKVDKNWLHIKINRITSKLRKEINDSTK